MPSPRKHNKIAAAANQRARRRTVSGRAYQLLRAAEWRSKRKNLSCSLTRDWIEQRLRTGTCEVSGLPFDLSGEGCMRPFAPSIDRITVTKGYSPDNCRMILWALNTAFSGWGEDTFKGIAKAWLNYSHSQHSSQAPQS